MKIGLDYYNTITQFPEIFYELSWRFYGAPMGHDLYIVSAVGHKRLAKSGGLEKYREEIDAYKIGNTETIIVVFDDEKDIPQLKLDVCRKYKIDMFIDDRPETVKLLHENGIMALLMPKPMKKLRPEQKVEKT